MPFHGIRPPRHHVGVDVRRARQVQVRGVELAQDLRQDAARENVLVRVGAVPRPRSPPEHGVVLVVAAPERKRGVITQALHHLDRLLAQQLVQSRVVLRVLRAGEAEVLPHQHAVLVAPVPEPLRLVQSAAPHADHVAVRLADKLERGDDAVLVAAVERVHGHPARPAHEARLAVHDELHLARLLRGDVVVGEDELELAHAEAERLLRQDLLRGDVPPLHLHVVERGLTEPERPPEVGVLDAEADARRPVEHPGARTRDNLALARHRHLDLRGVETAERALQTEVKHVLRGTPLHVDVQLRAEVVADALRPAHHHARVAEDARRDEAREDVPADHVRGFAERLELGGGPRVADCRDFAELRFDHGRAEEDGEIVLALTYERRHVERVRDEHVRRLAHLASVHEHVAQRVESIELEERLLVLCHLSQRELPRVEPLVSLVLPHRVLVVRVEEVRQPSRRTEIQLVAARHLRGHGDRLRRYFLERPHAPAVRRGPPLQLPLAVQRHHRRRDHQHRVHSVSPVATGPAR